MLAGDNTNPQQFMQRMTKKVQEAILTTPAAKQHQTIQVVEEDEQTIRRSGRLAVKQRNAGNKKAEELAQQVLAKKLGLLPDNEMTKEARNKILQLFQMPLTEAAMRAMEDLLKAMSIDNVKVSKSANKAVGKKAK